MHILQCDYELENWISGDDGAKRRQALEESEDEHIDETKSDIMLESAKD
jgi:hypothetical protein